MSGKNDKLLSITFDKLLTTDILSAFGKTTKIDDGEEFIIDGATGEKVLTQNGEPIRISEFAGLTKGSEIYLKSDLVSLIQYVEKQAWTSQNG